MTVTRFSFATAIYVGPGGRKLVGGQLRERDLKRR
jgi:hypothetical protein